MKQLLIYIAVFFAGGYLIPFTMFFSGVYIMDQKSSDNPTTMESFMTAFLAALFWPFTDTRFEGEDE